MSFSAALGVAQLGMSFLGASSAQKQANAALAQRQYEFQKTMELQQMQMGMAMDAQRAQAEENAYQRQIEQMNRLIAQQERDYDKKIAEQQQAQLLEERKYAIDRQIEEDKAAAKQRQFQIEQLLQNQSLTQQERDFAVQQLNEAKSIASGERDADMRLFAQQQFMAQQERDFYVQQLQQAQGQYAQERNQDLAIQSQILAQLQGLQGELNATSSALGAAPQMQQLTEADIAAEIDRRTSQYMSDVDRAADRVASINEADLMRTGMDSSTKGTSERAKIAAQLASEYEKARSLAYDDALKYITGKTSALSTNVNDIMANRKAILGEVADVSGASIPILQNLPKLSSATGAYNLLSGAPTAIYNRSLVSANDYKAPVTINSGVYDDILSQVGTGMSSFLNMPSAATISGMSASSAMYNPLAQTIGNPASYMQNAGTLQSSMLSSSDKALSNAYTRASSAGEAFGSALADFGKNYGDKIDAWWDGLSFNKGD